MFSFSTICFNFWKSSNLPSYPLLSVQFSGIKDTHIIVQPASPSSHRLFYIKNETMSQLCTNTSFSLLSTPGKHSVPLIFMNLPSLRTSYEWNSDGVFFLSFFLPVVKYTQHKIDHLSIFSAQVSGIKSIHLLCSHHHHASPYSFFLPETWGSTGPNSPPPPIAPDNHHPAFCLYGFAYSANLINTENTIRFFVTVSFYWTQWLQGASRL